MANATSKVNNIEKSLIDQLKARNAFIDAFKGLVSDYVAMYSVCEELKADIKERGITIVDYTASGRAVNKPNPSIKELRDTNKSMLMILKQLGLDLDTVKVKSDNDEL